MKTVHQRNGNHNCLFGLSLLRKTLNDFPGFVLILICSVQPSRDSNQRASRNERTNKRSGERTFKQTKQAPSQTENQLQRETETSRVETELVVSHSSATVGRKSEIMIPAASVSRLKKSLSGRRSIIHRRAAPVNIA